MAPPARILLCGDVMTARGVDQVLPHPGDPTLWEPSIRDARGYVTLAEARAGPIPRPMTLAGPWGDASAAIEAVAPDAFVVNLETSVTARGRPWPKGINYRMHPANVGLLAAGHVDVAVLANNHVLDFDREGLLDTLDAVTGAGVRVCGAGRTADAARAPAVVGRPGGRVLVFALCTTDSGAPPEWAATERRPGVWHVDVPTGAAADAVVAHVTRVRRPGDRVVVSVHWGSNWGYEVPPSWVRFAHRLVDGGVDVVHGHSSHHPRPVEVYRGRPILYGCGDFLNDYEGIRGYEAWRPELVLLYDVTVGDGGLERFELVPFRIRRLRLEHVGPTDADWLAGTLSTASAPFGVRVARAADRLVVVTPPPRVPGPPPARRAAPR